MPLRRSVECHSRFPAFLRHGVGVTRHAQPLRYSVPAQCEVQKGWGGYSLSRGGIYSPPHTLNCIPLRNHPLTWDYHRSDFVTANQMPPTYHKIDLVTGNHMFPTVYPPVHNFLEFTPTNCLEWFSNYDHALKCLFRSLCSPAIVSVHIPFRTIIPNEGGEKVE